MKKVAILFAAVGTLALMACGPDNVAECKAYVEKVNGEYESCEIDTGTLDEASTCPDSLNEGGADCTEYYQCLGDAYKCEDDGTVSVDTSGCTGCV